MDKQTVAHSYNGILLSNKKEWIINIHNLDTFQVHYAEWNKPVLGYLPHGLCDSFNMTFSKRQNYTEGEQICGYQGIKGLWR